MFAAQAHRDQSGEASISTHFFVTSAGLAENVFM
jgi:hypothetical protein